MTALSSALARPPISQAVAANESPQRLAQALFNHEGQDLYPAAYAHNAPYAKSGPYQSRLTPEQQAAFRAWVARYQVPVTKDYDMPGYFLSTGGAPHAPGQHFPDTFKTPYDTTFSGESQYAKPGTPFVWRGNSLIDANSGKLIFAPTGGQ